MKSFVVALLSVFLLLGPVGQVLAHCCAGMTAEGADTMAVAAETTAETSEQAPCHGAASAGTMPETQPTTPQKHQHDCTSTVDCCGAAVSALADAPVEALVVPTRVALPSPATAAAHHIPDSLYRPPRSS